MHELVEDASKMLVGLGTVEIEAGRELLGISPGSVARPRVDSSLGRVDPPKGTGDVARQRVGHAGLNRRHQRGEPRAVG